MASDAPSSSLPRPRTTVGGATRLERLARLLGSSGRLPLTRIGGRISEVSASHVAARGLANSVRLGSIVEIESEAAASRGEVIAVRQDVTTLKLLCGPNRLNLGARVWLADDLAIRPDRSWLGRVVNALGQPIDGKADLLEGAVPYQLDREPLAAMSLDRVRRPCLTGIKAIDLFTPLCAGQRIGIFAGSGVGKSTLVSMLARSTSFKTLVLALVAERAREVRELVEDVIGASGARAVTVVAASSESAMMRKLAARTAMTIAEYFRDCGDEVLLIVDSITRHAHAVREAALAAGEPPVARGYPPSVFSELPRLIERAGPGAASSGSITAVLSVLVDGDDHNDPVADAVRGILDGHIVLDRAIAEQGRYPAINPLASVSRLAHVAWSKDEAALVRRLRALISRYEETQELRSLGAYRPGSDAELDQAVALAPVVYKLMLQLPDDPPCAQVFDELARHLSEIKPRATPEDGQHAAARKAALANRQP
jgi:flagellum-specific ATP synthase